jgi:hypothetical protein
LVSYASRPAAYEALLCQKIDEIGLDRLEDVFRDPGSHDASHYIVIIEPSPTGRFAFERKVASRRVLELLWEKHIQHRIDHMAYFYRIFQASPAAEWIFQLRMHQLFPRRRTVRLFRICGRRAGVNLIYDDYTLSGAENNPTDILLPRSDELPLVEGAQLRMNCYYRPKSDSFSGIDSVFLIHPPDEATPILLMFQIARGGTEYNVNVDGLRKVDGLALPPGTCRCCVVVVPGDVRPKVTVPMKYFEDDEQQRMSADEMFPVFHYPVDMGELFGHY